MRFLMKNVYPSLHYVPCLLLSLTHFVCEGQFLCLFTYFWKEFLRGAKTKTVYLLAEWISRDTHKVIFTASSRGV